MSKLSSYVSHVNGNANTLGGHSASFYSSQGSTYTKQEVDGKISNLVDSAPDLLNTLNEISASLGDDPNFATNVSNSIGLKLDFSDYTAADVLTKIKTVDGDGSGLDADLLDGHQSSYFAIDGSTDSSIEVDAKIAALVDGSPSALNTLNKLAASLGDDPDFSTTVSTNLGLKLDSSVYTAADVLTKIRTVDGAGSGLNADVLDGHEASYFLTTTGKAADADKLDGHDSSYFVSEGEWIDGGAY